MSESGDVMVDLGGCPECGRRDLKLVYRKSFFGKPLFFVYCRSCRFATKTSKTTAGAEHELCAVRSAINAYKAKDLLRKVMQLPVMQQCLIDLKQGQGVDLDEGKVLIQAFVATGIAKQEDFEGLKDGN